MVEVWGCEGAFDKTFDAFHSFGGHADAAVFPAAEVGGVEAVAAGLLTGWWRWDWSTVVGRSGG